MQDALVQAKERLADYQKLVTYLKQANKIDTDANKKFTMFSEAATVPEAETVAGLKNNAQVLRTSVAQYQKLDTPEVLKELATSVNSLTLKIADALGQEAQAIAAHDDATSKQTWDTVNDLQDQIAQINEKEQAKLAPQSSTMKPITDLPKLTQNLKF